MRNRRLLSAAICTGALMTTAVLAPAAHASSQDRSVSGRDGTTTVVLNPQLVPVLVNNLKVRAIKPGALTSKAGLARLSFPITEVEGKTIEHSGGLAFTPLGGGRLQISRFNVDLGTGFLNAKAKLNGRRIPGRVDIFQLGAVQPVNGAAPSCDGTAAGLTLTPAAANALGAPSFAGAFVGDACVAPDDEQE